MKIYTGVGSRKTPHQILQVMRRLALKLASDGWICRSGGAAGADSAFAAGAGSSAEIYRPEQATPAALSMAASVHPAWSRCHEPARRLHARNCFQVLGLSLDAPSKFLVCWTPDGAVSGADCSIRTGGTGMAIRLAEKHGVPVRNLARADHLAAALAWLDK